MDNMEIPNWSSDDVLLYNQLFDNGNIVTNSESVEEISNASSELSSASPISYMKCVYDK